MSLGINETCRIVCAPVSTKATGATLLFSTVNRRFVVTRISVDVAASSAITISATMSFGTNSASYNDLVTAALLAGLTAANLNFPMTLSATPPTIPAATGVYANVTIAATGTSQTVTPIIEGFYLD